MQTHCFLSAIISPNVAALYYYCGKQWIKQFVTFNDVFIQGNGYIRYCFHEYNMTCTCEKCNQKRVIDFLFVKVDVNLHIARQTQLFLKVNSLSSGTMAESCWESSSEEELCLMQSTFTVKSDEYDGKYLMSVVAIPLVLSTCV